MTVTDEHTDAERTKAELAAECHRAKREMPKVGIPGPPTPWDVRHGELDAMLTRLLGH